MAVQDPMKWFRRQTAPVTVVLCALIVIGSLATWATNGNLAEVCAYPGTPFPRIWTLVTYPFISFPNPIFLLFEVMWMFWVGSTLERDHGTRNFIVLWLVVSALGVLPLTFYGYPNAGMLIPGAIMVTIWGTRYPNVIINIFMIIPVAIKWLAMLTVASVFFTYAHTPSMIPVGLLAISGCILGFFYARNQLPGIPYGLRKRVVSVKSKPSKAELAREKEYFDDVYRREKEREEKERLRKLFEGSLEDDK